MSSDWLPPLAKQRINGKLQDARTAVLVFHFPFNSGEQNLKKRMCNQKDVNDLRETYKLFSGCTFLAIESPSRALIFEKLRARSTQELFSADDGAPKVLKVFVLSHGGENGLIYTDTSNETFYAKEIVEELEQNLLLQDSLKILIFGSCKGINKEARVPSYQWGVSSPNSLSIFQEFNKMNLVVFNATLEGNLAYNDEGGSWVVNAVCQTQRSQEKEVNVLEFCRMVAQVVSAKSAYLADQCPQYSVSQHPDVFLSLRYAPIVATDGQGCTGNIIPPSRIHHYNSDKNKSRGLSPIFFDSNVHVGADLVNEMRSLGFRAATGDVDQIEATLKRIACSSKLDEEESLFVMVICKIVVTNDERPELAIEINGGQKVPIRQLARPFVANTCAPLVSKPKVFLVFDPLLEADANINREASLTKEVANSTISVLQVTSQVQVIEESCLNHADFIVAACFGEDTLIQFMRGLLKSYDKATGETLHDLLLETMQISSRGVGHVWSTMTNLLDFPDKRQNLYSKPQFQLEGQINQKYSFDKLVQTLLQRDTLLTMVHGQGKTRLARELYVQFVIRYPGYVVLAQLDALQVQPHHTVIDFLKATVTYSALALAKSSLQAGNLFVIADWGEVKKNNNELYALELMKQLTDARVKVLVLVHDYERESMLNGMNMRLQQSETFKIDISECHESVREQFNFQEQLAAKEIFKNMKNRSFKENNNFGHSFFFPQRIVSHEKTKVFRYDEHYAKEYVPNIEYRDAHALARAIKTSPAGSIVLLSSDAGMGKSTNIKRVERYLQRDLEDSMVIRLDLRSCYKSVNGCTLKLETCADAISHLLEEVLGEIDDAVKDLARKVLFGKVETQQMILLLDAFDEIRPMHRLPTLRLLQLLKQTKLKMLVSTRPHEEEAVAQALGLNKLDYFALEPIRYSERPEFVVRVWNKPELYGDAETLLKNLYKFCSGEKLLSTPLNLLLVAKNFPDGKLSDAFIQHKDLYKVLIAQNTKLALGNKLNLNNPMIEPSVYLKIEISCNELLRKLAVKECFGEDSGKLKNEDEYILRFPFLAVQGEGVIFVQKTFAEYLVAGLIYEQLTDATDSFDFILSEEQCKSIFTDKRHAFVRDFLDTVFVTNSAKNVAIVKKLFSVDAGYVCLIESRFNIFKMFRLNGAVEDKFFTEVMENGKYPIQILGSSKYNNRLATNSQQEFIEFLVQNGSSLLYFITSVNCKQILDKLMSSGLNKMLIENWEDVFQGHFDASVVLLDAFKHKCGEFAEFLLRRGTDWTNDHFVSSAKNGLYGCLNLMLELNDSQVVDAVNKDGVTALMEAARYNHVACVQLLLAKGADPCKTDKNGHTSLVISAECDNDMESFKVIYGSIERYKKDLNKLLVAAAWHGRLDAFLLVLEDGADVEAQDEDGKTCLHIAALLRNGADLLKMLLNRFSEQLDVNAKDKCGSTPLHLAAHLVVGFGSEENVDILLKHGANVSLRDRVGRTPLHYAAWTTSLRICEALLKVVPREEVNARDSEGETPLLLAGGLDKYDNAIIIKLLVGHGADVTAVNNKRQNILHRSAKNLLDFPSDEEFWRSIPVNGKCDGGVTPLMMAAAGDDIGLLANVQLLLARGADPCEVDDRGWNCLHHAAISRVKEGVEFLLDVVDPRCKTNDGQTVAMIIREKWGSDGAHYQQILQQLQEELEYEDITLHKKAYLLENIAK